MSYKRRQSTDRAAAHRDQQRGDGSGQREWCDSGEVILRTYIALSIDRKEQIGKGNWIDSGRYSII